MGWTHPPASNYKLEELLEEILKELKKLNTPTKPKIYPNSTLKPR